MAAWKQGRFRVSGSGAILTRDGWTYNGLGITQVGSIFAPRWHIIHLNSGHAIARIDKGSLASMQALAAEIADAGDWSFDGLTGFQNQFPDAAERVHEIVMKHRPDLRRRPTATVPDPVAAHAIAMLREDEQHPALTGKDIEHD